MSADGDARLAEILEQAFAPDHFEPPAGRVHALRRAAIQRTARATQAGPRRWAGRSSVGMVAAMLVLGLAGVAAAAPGVPGPLRALAHDLGLSAPAPESTAAQASLQQLRSELAKNDSVGVKRALNTLQHDMRHLDAGKAQQIEDEARPLIAAAAAVAVISKAASSDTPPGPVAAPAPVMPVATAVVLHELASGPPDALKATSVTGSPPETPKPAAVSPHPSIASTSTPTTSAPATASPTMPVVSPPAPITAPTTAVASTPPLITPPTAPAPSPPSPDSPPTAAAPSPPSPDSPPTTFATGPSERTGDSTRTMTDPPPGECHAG